MIKALCKNVAWVCVAVLLSNCGGSGGVGDQSDVAPEAKAEVFGASSETSGVIEVRSGKEVLLSGSNSDGIDDPLLSFSWRQIDSSGYELDLYERTANSVAFTAPKVPLTSEAGVQLDFELQVTDADGETAVDTVSVLVKPAYDADQFLLNPRIDERFIIIVAAPAGENVSADIPFSLEFSTTAEWQDRLGNTHTLALQSKTYTGEVVAGMAPAITDQRNAYYKIAIPLLDTDDINLNFQGDLRSSRLELENVATAFLTISLELTQQSSGNIQSYLARETDTSFELLSETGATRDGSTLSFSDEWLRQNVLVESRRSTNNYYDCIDPDGYSDTLAEWIDYAGFNVYPESIVHTSYVNNYDLNFGRDMYVRRDANNNVYTYVTNYPSLENIFSGRNEFAVVAMEYSAAPTGDCGDGTFTDDATGKKIVKFYSFVPDELTGDYVRTNSMNFDGRGERLLPGVCVACHYGDTNSDQFNALNLADIDAGAADLNSSFIPWDLDAFLFTDDINDDFVDPIYDAAEISPEITANFSRQAQQDEFRQQNQIILDTFTHDINNLKRFEIPIKMVQGWYGNKATVEPLNFGSEETPLSINELLDLKTAVSTLPNNPFNGRYVQRGWEGQEDLYHDVFVRNCRICHAQVANQTKNFDSYEEFVNNDRIVSYVFEQGAMPLSRLTMDRFWVSFYGDTSPAETLRNHLNSDNNPTNDVAIGSLPGYPVAKVSPSANPELDADVSIDFDGRILFDANDSQFTSSYEWNLNGAFVSDAEKYEYIAEAPGASSEITFIAINTQDALVSPTLRRSIQVNDNTPQANGVPSPAVNEGESVSVNIFTSLCPTGAPDSALCRSVFGDVRTGEVPLLEIAGTATNGNATVTDTALGIVQFTSTSASFQGDGEFSFTLTDSFGETSDPGSVTVTINAIDGPEIVAPDTCSVDAKNNLTEINFPQIFGSAPCLDPSVNDIVAGGLNLQTVEVGVPTQVGSTVSVDNAGVVSYTPGRFFVGMDSFAYTVQDDSLSERTNRGTVVVTVNANQTYTSLSTGSGVFARAGVSDGCAECHSGGAGDTEPSWLEIANLRLVATNTNVSPYGSAEITLAEPTTTIELLSAIIFQNACDAFGTHAGGNRLCNTAGSPDEISDLNEDGLSILRWIEEGTQDN